MAKHPTRPARVPARHRAVRESPRQPAGVEGLWPSAKLGSRPRADRMLGMDDPPAVTEHPWWVSAARAHLETTPVEPAPVLAPAIITWRDLVPAIPARPITHRVAVCRWCGGRFYRAHERPPQWLCLSAA